MSESDLQRCVKCGRERGVADAPLMRCEADNAEYCSFSEAAVRRAVEKIADEYKELLTTRAHLMHSKVPELELQKMAEIITTELQKGK